LVLPEQSPTLSSAEALRRLARGRDVDAWTAIVRMHGVQILGVTRRILNDAALAEDACQETLLQVRDRAGQFKGRRALIPGLSPRPSASDDDAAARNWIMRIACNTALHLLRQRKRALARESVPMTNTVVVDQHERNELVELVRGEMAELPESQRLPLVLHFYAGLGYEELGKELRCGVNAAKARVHRALKKLRERLALVGFVVSAAALYTLLNTTPAWAAEVVLDPQRTVQWQNLLMSSRQAAVDVLSDGRLPILAKLGYCAATAAICSSLALTQGDSSMEKAKPTSAATIEKLERKMEAAATKVDAPKRVEIPQSVTDTAEGREVRRQKIAKAKSAEVREAPVAQTQSAIRNPQSEMVRSTPLVSSLSELKMLCKVQHDLNARVARIYQEMSEAEINGLDVMAFHERLQRAAEEQAAISDLLERVAMDIQREADGLN
jgi:RNA polymerase sigma-70 factor (ECF subfamily)